MTGWETVEAVRRGDLTVGTFLSSASPVVADVAARGGLDWLVVDLEHGAPDLGAAASIARSLRTSLPVLARTPPSDRHSTEAMLDAGAAGVIVPRVESAGSAAAALAVTQYAGGRGLARTTPRFGWGAETTDPLVVDPLVLRVVQIETAAALDEVEMIASLPMVDVLFLGPADLRLDLRRHERDSSTALDSAACRVLAAARNASKVAGTLVRSLDALERWWTLGYTFLACSADVLMVADGARDIAAEAVRLRRAAARASALGSAKPTDMKSYRSVDERLAEWRRASLVRQGRLDELAQVPDPDFHGRNIAARVGAIARVDSFLATINCDDPASAYAPPNRVEASGFRFVREKLTHPTLLKLKEAYKLIDVAGEGDDLGRAVRLRNWVSQRWPHQVPLSNPPYDGLTILERAANGEGFLCMHYAVTLMQCCLAVGIDARIVNLHRGVAESYPIGEEDTIDPPVDEHVVTEVYAPDRKRWVVLDPDFDCHFELYNEPLSAWDIHNARLAGERITAIKGPGALPYEGLRSSGRAGPLLGSAARDDRARTEWYETTLTAYYAHVSIWMRNDFLSDPEGPVPIMHLTDAVTPSILWHRGEYIRLGRDLLGPLAVAQPYTNRTPVLTDGNLESAWASEDASVEHWVELHFPSLACVSRVILHWPESGGRFCSSRRYRVEGNPGNQWEVLADAVPTPARPWTVHDLDPPARLSGLRIIQPPEGGSLDHPNRLWLSEIECH